MREVVAEAARPVMLYSVGKDSAVMLHLARKAFAPSPPPFPLLHVDTTWKFRAMYELRDRMAAEAGMRLIVHTQSGGRGARDQPVRSWRAAHRFVEDRRAEAGARRRRLSTRRSAARGATRRRAAPRNASSRSARPATAGTPRTSGPNCGTSTMRGSRRARASASFPFPIGPSSTCGATSSARISRSSRSTSPRRARPWCATA